MKPCILASIDIKCFVKVKYLKMKYQKFICCNKVGFKRIGPKKVAKEDQNANYSRCLHVNDKHLLQIELQHYIDSVQTH